MSAELGQRKPLSNPPSSPPAVFRQTSKYPSNRSSGSSPPSPYNRNAAMALNNGGSGDRSDTAATTQRHQNQHIIMLPSSTDHHTTNSGKKYSSKDKSRHVSNNNKRLRVCAALALLVVFVILVRRLDDQSTTTFNNSGSMRSSLKSAVNKYNYNNNPASLAIWKRRGVDVDPPVTEEEDAYRGAFHYVDSPQCQSKINNFCTIYFPSYDEANPTTCWNDSDSSSNNALCMMTLRGSKGHSMPNQDRSVVIQSATPGEWSLAALFDGHGDLGHVTSQIAVSDLASKLLAAVADTPQPSNVPELFHTTYLEIDQGQMAEIPRAGTTALTVLQQGSMVYLASAGDSTAVLVQWLGYGGDAEQQQQQQSASSQKKSKEPWYRRLWNNKRGSSSGGAPARDDVNLPYKILASSVKHKPADLTEKIRIEAAGGMVHIPFDPNQSSRVVYPVRDEASGMMMQMALAMSRSLGDKDGKQLGVVVADPDVVTVDLKDHISSENNNNNRFFVVLASDGVTDMVPDIDAIAPLGRALYEGDNSSSLLHSTVQGILTSAVEQWSLASGYSYRDDISLTVQKLELSS